MLQDAEVMPLHAEVVPLHAEVMPLHAELLLCVKVGCLAGKLWLALVESVDHHALGYEEASHKEEYHRIGKGCKRCFHVNHPKEYAECGTQQRGDGYGHRFSNFLLLFFVCVNIFFRKGGGIICKNEKIIVTLQENI